MVVVDMIVLGGILPTSGHRDNFPSCMPWSSRLPVRMVYLSGSKMITVSLEKRTLKSASQKGTIPTSEFLKEDNM